MSMTPTTEGIPTDAPSWPVKGSQSGAQPENVHVHVDTAEGATAAILDAVTQSGTSGRGWASC